MIQKMQRIIGQKNEEIGALMLHVWMQFDHQLAASVTEVCQVDQMEHKSGNCVLDVLEWY